MELHQPGGGVGAGGEGGGGSYSRTLRADQEFFTIESSPLLDSKVLCRQLRVVPLLFIEYFTLYLFKCTTNYLLKTIIDESKVC